MALEKTFNAAEAESRIYADWETKGAFKAGANAQRDAHFSVMIPPPNVTGSLHMGHAFNNTLQDILVRWHRMQGFDTLWQPGQDHAGIATQMVVERELAATGQPGRRELGREAFTAKVWEQKQKSGGTIIDQLRRLGASCDWSRNAFTMSGAPGAPAGEEGNFHDAVIKVFVDMYNKGLIYRGKRLVNWDPHFETAISDLEVESIEVDGHMWHFKYPLAGGETYTYVERDEDGNVLFEETRDYISIATTRPETMLGDGAVAVHPSDERYASIVGKLCEIPVGPKEQRRLIPIITDEYPDKNFGSGAVKITGAHDFNDYGVAKRNGIPLYALMDTQGKMRADGLPYDQAAARAQAIAEGSEAAPEDATEINLVPEAYRGLDRFEARKRVVEDVTAKGLAVMTEATDPRLGRAAKKAPVEPGEGGEMRTEEESLVPLVEAKKIMQPFGDRSKVVIEPMLTDQWFVATDKIVQPAIDAVRSGEVTILPEQDRKVYFHWLENIEPWCISRQLWWGHQIPVWYGLAPQSHNDKTLEFKSFCGADFEAVKAQAIELYEARFPNDKIIIEEMFGDPEQGWPQTKEEFDVYNEFARLNGLEEQVYVEKIGSSRKTRFKIQNDRKTGQRELTFFLRRDPDVLDTWFSSGLWPIGTLGWPEQTAELEKYFPTSVLVTGFDIIFFWVARMMMMQYAVVDQKPFDTVYVHALVRDEKGKKMSKSLGNVLDPLELIDDYGADAVRFTLTSMAAMGRDLKLSTQRIAGYRNFGTKLWNAHRFAEMNGVFEAMPAGMPQPTATLNKWIVGETARVREEVDAALGNFRFNDAANALYAFVWGKVCDWYVELSKPLLQDDAPEAEETRATMAWVLEQCLILLHPIMPFITEELWQTTAKRDELLALTDWPAYTTADLLDADADRELNWVIGLIESIRSARQQMHVPAGLKVPMLVTEMDEAAQGAWDRNEVMIKRLARVEGLEKADSFPKGTVSIAAPGTSFGLPLAGLIDIDAEKARLQKSLDKLGKEIGGLRGRLNNPKFAASAPEEVVAEAQANLAARQEEADQLQAALDRLAELG
ncbi:valine--tRNA ligase [Sulfitobacter sp. KE34]|uniref:Valine--tRNA ligase n=2 Tax=Sulfitobacter TaxID=60136 RepID=A0AAX3LSW0_9RHOB|nr:MULTISPECIES: valine--tRNA ligase [Sulfitobacter]MDF3350293.1 valine--tRNA ligase [Sulfitobacter sp. KE12]MDF3354504.1 valine--tRNA ligase [Sulfitobacter sp. KE27]MDF3357613.1 valine--tRNA ligase [Sulfitobacter sp. KE33]MDF3360234.1 valine--tRNA ligase [Sulfitobacter sp. Ks41]MDF3365576.1 valine--tRNA ligase [Sulfitobacter sp. Ks34]